MSIQDLANSIESAVNNRIDEESRAMHGIIRNDRFVSGSKSYPMKQAVDCDTSEGSRVWAQKSKNGNAVVIGA